MRETVFHDRDGRAAAYSDDGVHLYRFDGTPVAYLHGHEVYSYSGAHLGWLERGWLRDRSGDCVFFSDGPWGDGPLRPERWEKPRKAAKAERPVKAERERPWARAPGSRSWSALDGAAFFASGQVSVADPDSRPADSPPEPDHDGDPFPNQ